MSEQHPESLSKHDPETNRRFIAIFDHPDNADVSRMFTVGLAINDEPVIEPDEPVDAEIVDAPGTDLVTTAPPADNGNTVLDGAFFTDVYGDTVTIGLVASPCDVHGTETGAIIRIADESVAIPLAALTELVAWVSERLPRLEEIEREAGK